MDWPRRATRLKLGPPTIDPWLLAGLVAFLGLLMVALFGARIAPHEPIYFVVEHGADPRPYDPGLVYPFGSDVLGRDLFSLVLAGARATLTIVVLAGLARVVAGTLVAAVGSWWRPARPAAEAIADLASAVPATLVALVLVKVFVKTADTSVGVFIGALLLTGWAGPYRVVRVEIDRLAHAGFAEGAAATGVGRWRLFWRHQLPHLVPTLAMNLSQQIVASLVLLAELGVLGVFVGSTRIISIEESLTTVVNGVVSAAQIADPPEWGGLLAGARTIESLWTTRWLVLVPGAAFALTALAVAAVGLSIARRYARRDVIGDLRSRGAAAFAIAVLTMFVASSLLPPRYAEASRWAADARAAVRPTADTAREFSTIGLRPLAGSLAIGGESARITQTGPATVTVGTVTITEKWPRDAARMVFEQDVRSFVTAGTGGGVVDASLVFAARGITPADYPPPATASVFAGKRPELGELIKSYPDDYAGIDVRGKIVLLVRFLGVAPKIERTRVIVSPTQGPGVEESISTAIKHGAAGVVFIDPALPLYSDRELPYIVGDPRGVSGGINPYHRAEQEAPPNNTSGVPVVVLSGTAGTNLGRALGIDLKPLLEYDRPDAFPNTASLARDLGVSAHLAVPLARAVATVRSVAGEVGDVPHNAGHFLIWAIRQPADPQQGADVLAALARTLAPRRMPFIFVDFDGSVDPKANAKAVRDAVGDRRISLVIVLGDLNGDALKLTTPYGDLIPALDLYAAHAGARAVVTQTTAPITALSGIAPYSDVKTVVLDRAGGSGDLSPDAAALVGYLAGRLALGAEELPR